MNDTGEIQDVLEQLNALAPGAADAPRPPTLALAQFKQRAESVDSAKAREKRRFTSMSNRRLVAAGMTLAAIVLLLMAFPSVRAAASEFLGLFRVQKFAPISVSPQQLAVLEQLEGQGMNPGEFVTVREPGDPVPVDSLEAASSLTGYHLRQWRSRDLPAEVFVTGEGEGYLVVDLAGARAILGAAGVDPMLLPDSLDGAQVNVHVYPSVQQLYTDGLMLMQTAVPDVSYPADIDPALLGEAVLQLLGTEPAAARQIAQTIDWTSTLLLPIPQSLGTYRDVRVQGGAGVLLEPFDPESDPALVWQKDGMIYMMTAPVSADELLSLAKRLQ